MEKSEYKKLVEEVIAFAKENAGKQCIITDRNLRESGTICGYNESISSSIDEPMLIVAVYAPIGWNVIESDDILLYKVKQDTSIVHDMKKFSYLYVPLDKIRLVEHKSKLPEVARYRNLTLGRLTQIKAAIDYILTSSPDKVRSTMDEEKEDLLRIKYALQDVVSMWRYNTKVLLEKIKKDQEDGKWKQKSNSRFTTIRMGSNLTQASFTITLL